MPISLATGRWEPPVPGHSLRPDSPCVTEDDATRFPATMRFLAYLDAAYLERTTNHASARAAAHRLRDTAMYAALEDLEVWL